MGVFSKRVTHLEVQQQDIGLYFAHEVEHFRAVLRLPYDFEVRLER